MVIALLLFLLSIASTVNAVIPSNQSKQIISGYQSVQHLEESNYIKEIVSKNSFVPHQPITVSCNNELAAQALAENWIGNGSSRNPYIIEGYNITLKRANLIEINNTTSYIEIRNCYLAAGEFGVYLYNATNVKISQNTVVSSYCSGISADSSSNISIVENELQSNKGTGIAVMYSWNCIISGNTVNNTTREGVFYIYSNSSLISNNCVQGNWKGIRISNSMGNAVISNTIADNVYDGVFLVRSENNTLRGNKITNNNGSGIETLSSYNNSFESNKIADSHSCGIELINSGNNSIKWNDFINNRKDFPQYDYGQAYDGLNDGENNTFDHNYWDDWTTPDNDSNGIVDAPYVIFGDSFSIDPYPRVIAHQLPAPDIIYPRGGETVTGTINITWIAVNDSLDHEVTYSVYLSADSGLTWKILETGMITNSLIWNSEEVTNGGTYRVKVEVTCSTGWTAFNTSTSDFSVQNRLETSNTGNTTTSDSINGVNAEGSFMVLLIASLVANLRKRDTHG